MRARGRAVNWRARPPTAGLRLAGRGGAPFRSSGPHLEPRIVPVEHYAFAALAIFAINLLPAFGPPTWALLVFLSLSYQLHPAVLVPIGAASATAGRMVLALATGAFRSRLSPRRVASLEALRDAVTARPHRALLGLGLFLVSPLPSNQLFMAAGLLAIPLRALAAAFFVGRLVAYSIYAGGAVFARERLGDLLLERLSSPGAIALQLGSLAVLGVLMAVDWARVLRRAGPASPAGSTSDPDGAVRGAGRGDEAEPRGK